MVTPCKVGGYSYRQQLNAAERACRTARQNLKLLIEERPSPTLAALYLAQIASALSDIQEAHGELHRIIPQEES